MSCVILRFFSDEGRIYLFSAVAGESGIAVAELILGSS